MPAVIGYPAWRSSAECSTPTYFHGGAAKNSPELYFKCVAIDRTIPLTTKQLVYGTCFLLPSIALAGTRGCAGGPDALLRGAVHAAALLEEGPAAAEVPGVVEEHGEGQQPGQRDSRERKLVKLLHTTTAPKQPNLKQTMNI